MSRVATKRGKPKTPPDHIHGWQVVSISPDGTGAVVLPFVDEKFARDYVAGMARFKCPCEARPVSVPDTTKPPAKEGGA